MAEIPDFDAVVIGAGLRRPVHGLPAARVGLPVLGVEAGDGVGGTWYWNRYPGARCDSESMYYSFSFLPEFEQEWPLEERYPTQPVILRYLQTVAERLDLPRTSVRGPGRRASRGTMQLAALDGAGRRRLAGTAAVRDHRDRGAVRRRTCPRSAGADTFAGRAVLDRELAARRRSAGRKRVGLIGTGSSGVQVLPRARPARRSRHGLPAHAAVRHPGPAGRRSTRSWWRCGRRTTRRSGARTKMRPRAASRSRPDHGRRGNCRAAERTALSRGGLAAGRDLVPRRHVQRRRHQPRGQRGRRRLRPRARSTRSSTTRTRREAEAVDATRGGPSGSRSARTTTRRSTAPNVRLVDLRDDPIEAITPRGIRTRRASTSST